MVKFRNELNVRLRMIVREMCYTNQRVALGRVLVELIPCVFVGTRLRVRNERQKSAKQMYESM